MIARARALTRSGRNLSEMIPIDMYIPFNENGPVGDTVRMYRMTKLFQEKSEGEEITE